MKKTSKKPAVSRIFHPRTSTKKSRHLNPVVVIALLIAALAITTYLFWYKQHNTPYQNPFDLASDSYQNPFPPKETETQRTYQNPFVSEVKR